MQPIALPQKFASPRDDERYKRRNCGAQSFCDQQVEPGVMELTFRGNLLFTARHDFNDAGITGGPADGNALNAAFNVPGFKFLHGYLESDFGATSELYGASGGPTWKGMLWLSVPITAAR